MYHLNCVLPSFSISSVKRNLVSPLGLLDQKVLSFLKWRSFWKWNLILNTKGNSRQNEQKHRLFLCLLGQMSRFITKKMEPEGRIHCTAIESPLHHSFHSTTRQGSGCVQTQTQEQPQNVVITCNHTNIGIILNAQICKCNNMEKYVHFLCNILTKLGIVLIQYLFE